MQLILYALEECPVVANRLPTLIKPKLNYKQTISINPNHVAILLKLKEESTILNFCPFLSLIFQVLAKFLPNIFVLESELKPPLFICHCRKNRLKCIKVSKLKIDLGSQHFLGQFSILWLLSNIWSIERRNGKNKNILIQSIDIRFIIFDYCCSTAACSQWQWVSLLCKLTSYLF